MTHIIILVCFDEQIIPCSIQEVLKSTYRLDILHFFSKKNINFFCRFGKSTYICIALGNEMSKIMMQLVLVHTKKQLLI